MHEYGDPILIPEVFIGTGCYELSELLDGVGIIVIGKGKELLIEGFCAQGNYRNGQEDTEDE